MTGCVKNDGMTKSEAKSSIEVEQALITCDPSAPRPTLAVIDFEVKAGHRSRHALANGLSDMLVNALVETQCFQVVERSRMKDIISEQGLGLGGTIEHSSAVEVGKLIGSKFLVMGVVTEFNENASSSSIPLPSWGRLRIGTSHLGLQIRIVDSTTGVILMSKSVNKKAKDFGVAQYSRFGSGGFYQSKSMQNAVEQAIIETVAIIVSQKELVATSIGYAQSAPASYLQAASSATHCPSIASPTGPRFMVVIPEIHISRRVPDPAGETEIIRLFLEAGFNVVDQQQIAAIRYQEKVLNAVKNTNAAVALGVEFGADIIVIGEAFSEFANRQGNMISCRARVEARAVQTSTGRILAANGTHAGGADISELVAGKAALRNAGTELGKYFITQICKSSQIQTGTGTAAIEIQITNINFRQLNRFTSMLESQPGVQNVSKQLTGNTARIQTQFSGGADDLATLITRRNNSGIRFNITGLSGNKITLTVTGEGEAAVTTSSDNETVRQIQECLIKLGYDPGTPDGKMGRKTAAAIRSYQRDVGIPIDGQATDSLLNSLKSKL